MLYSQVATAPPATVSVAHGEGSPELPDEFRQRLRRLIVERALQNLYAARRIVRAIALKILVSSWQCVHRYQ